MYKLFFILLLLLFILLLHHNCSEPFNNNDCKITIITSFYVVTKNKERTDELTKSLQNNINHKYVENIYLFLDNDSDNQFIKTHIKDSENKIIIYHIGKQPLYSDLFNCANKLENKICMVTNSDIWLYPFTDISEQLIELLNKQDNIVYILTRHEYDMTTPLINNNISSHDSFIFKSNINENIINNIKHKQNILGSEHKVKGQLLEYKYKLYNPYKDIKIIHEHKSGYITYGKKHLQKRYSNFGRIRIKPCKGIAILNKYN